MANGCCLIGNIRREELEARDLIAQIAIGQQLESLDHRMLNRMGTVNSKVSPGIFGGGGGNGCARRTVSIVS